MVKRCRLPHVNAIHDIEDSLCEVDLVGIAVGASSSARARRCRIEGMLLAVGHFYVCLCAVCGGAFHEWWLGAGCTKYFTQDF